jgi:ribosome biogenesis GTPase A
MAKTKRLLTEQLQLIDVVIELLDARIPYSSKNPDLAELAMHKHRIIVLNKSDLADPRVNQQWQNFFSEQNSNCILVDTPKGKGLELVKDTLRALCQESIMLAKSKGRISRPIRAMIVGIPNVGKSSFINKIVGKSIAITGDKPGVTRSRQWIRISPEIELLDTPGILWPKFEEEQVGIHLASTGAIKDTVFDPPEVCARLLENIKSPYASLLFNRYKLSNLDGNGYDILAQIGKNRGCIVSKGEIDLFRASNILLDEFRGGKIGKISLELPS